MFNNTLKQKLTAGEVCWGVLDSTASCEICEMIGYLGFDFVLLDTEHGKLNTDNLENCVRACEHSGAAPIVRPPMTKPEFISPFLDRGAWGVYLPHFATREMAEEVVDATRYHPQGHRGYMPNGRTNRFGYDMPVQDYLEAANREVLVIGLVEDSIGLETLDDMLTVDGIDAFWIGAGDLSQSLGYPGQVDHPEILSAMDDAIKKIVKAGKYAGWARSDTLVPRYLDLGAQLFHSSVQKLMKAGTVQYFGEWNSTKG